MPTEPSTDPPSATPVSRAVARALAVAAVVGTCAAMIAGCSGSDGPVDRSTPSATQASEANAASEGPQDGGAATIDRPAVAAVVAATLDEPIAMVPRPGDDGYVWVAQRSGQILRLALADGAARLDPEGDALLDLSDATTTDVERGLLGIAFAPDGEQIFVSLTDEDGNSKVMSYDVVGSADDPVIDLQSEQLRFAIDQPYPNHNGGHLAFGPDGQLWLGLGDGGLADDPANRAQDPETPLGKVIRLDVLGGDGEVGYEIVVSGVRNPWRWSFDTDGSLWIADVGQNAIEEIDHLPADQIDGANLGWSGYEGTQPYLDGDGRRPSEAVEPVFEYRHDDGNCSITGGFAYRGTAIPELVGWYLFADYCAGRVRAIRLADGAFAEEIDLGVDVENPISFGTDAGGEAYVLSQAGEVIGLVPA